LSSSEEVDAVCDGRFACFAWLPGVVSLANGDPAGRLRRDGPARAVVGDLGSRAFRASRPPCRSTSPRDAACRCRSASRSWKVMVVETQHPMTSQESLAEWDGGLQKNRDGDDGESDRTADGKKERDLCRLDSQQPRDKGIGAHNSGWRKGSNSAEEGALSKMFASLGMRSSQHEIDDSIKLCTRAGHPSTTRGI
jgi:hypothetical protein